MFRGLNTILLLIICTWGFSQGQARITVRENNGGISKIQIQEFSINDEEDIQSALRGMGLLDSEGKVRSGVEVQVEMLDHNSLEKNNYSIFSIPPDFSTPPPSSCQAYLGVMLKDSNTNLTGVKGAVVSGIEPLSPASVAGIQAGDIILRMDKKEIQNAQDAIIYVRGKCKGDKVKLKIQRGKKKKNIEVVLVERHVPQANSWDIPGNMDYGASPDMFGGGNEKAYLGVTPAQEQTPSGARVIVQPNSSAEKMGIRNLDVITELNQEAIISFDDLANKIAQMKPNDDVEIVVNRDGKVKRLSGQLGSRMVGGSGDFRYFFDDKGLDEGGFPIIDFEFDMDMNDIQKQLERLMQDFNANGSQSISRNKIRIIDSTSDENNLLGVCNDTPDFDLFSITPNAQNNEVILRINPIDDAPVRIELLDEKGDIIFVEERKIELEYERSMEIENQSYGRYFIRVSQGTKCISRVIQKSEE